MLTREVDEGWRREKDLLSDGNGDGSGADLLAGLSSDGGDEGSSDDRELHFGCCWKGWLIERWVQS